MPIICDKKQYKSLVTGKVSFKINVISIVSVMSLALSAFLPLYPHNLPLPPATT